ncbi:MAG: energy transducer TonB [Gammaproteobacteria bacterium]|nr:energy transducer TonB [Gammaproteobacteria bacterium]
MKQRSGRWLLAIVLSQMLHGLLYSQLTKHDLLASPAVERLHQPIALHFSFQQPTPKEPENELEPEAAPEPEPELAPEPAHATFPEPDPQQQLRPEPKSRPEPKPESKPKPKSRKKPESKPKSKPRPETRTDTVPASAAESQTAPEKVDTAALKQRYLATLLASIEQYKSYPRAARRRSIEGRVRVSFTLRCDGSVVEISMPSGHKLLKRSAEEAVRLAQPFPKPPAEIDCPLAVDYAMAFELR